IRVNSSERLHRQRLRRHRSPVTEEFAFLDDPNHFRWNQSLPSAVTTLQFGHPVCWTHPQVLGTIMGDLFDELVVEQILKQRAEIRRDFELLCSDDFPRPLVDHRINIKLQSALKHATKRFQNSTFKI